MLYLFMLVSSFNDASIKSYCILDHQMLYSIYKCPTKIYQVFDIRIYSMIELHYSLNKFMIILNMFIFKLNFENQQPNIILNEMYYSYTPKFIFKEIEIDYG